LDADKLRKEEKNKKKNNFAK